MSVMRSSGLGGSIKINEMGIPLGFECSRELRNDFEFPQLTSDIYLCACVIRNHLALERNRIDFHPREDFCVFSTFALPRMKNGERGCLESSRMPFVLVEGC